MAEKGQWESLPPPPKPRRQGSRQSRTTRIVLGIAAVLIVGLIILVVIDKRTNLVSGRGQSETGETGPTLAEPTLSASATADCVEDEIPNLPVDAADACLTQIANERGYVADPQHGAFVVSYKACSAFSVKELAKEFRTDPAPDSVAQAYASDLFTPEAQGASHEGCLLALT